VIWPNSGFWSWLWQNRTSKYSYDVISMTSSHHYVTKKHPQN